MSVSDAVEQERKPPLTIRGWSFFDKVRFRWGGAGDIVLGISLIGGVHSAGGIVIGVLFIMLGIATWILTRFGSGTDGRQWYSAWNTMPTASRVIAGAGSVIGMAFFYILFFWFLILRWAWKYIIAPSL
jgi:hypothetical protein